MVDSEETQMTRDELLGVKKFAGYTLPIEVWLWLRNEAIRRETSASELIVELVRKEQAVAA